MTVSFFLLTPVASLFAQKTYFNISFSYDMLGTTHGLRKGMEASHYDAKAVNSWFGSMDYPKVEKYPSTLVEVGRMINKSKSVAMNAGLTDFGWVKGYNGTYSMNIKHNSILLNPKINFHRVGGVLGVGPTLLFYHYSHYEYATKRASFSKTLAGLNLTANTISNKQKAFKTGAFAALNLYPSFSTPILYPNGNGPEFKAAKLNPSTLRVGIIFQFS